VRLFCYRIKNFNGETEYTMGAEVELTPSTATNVSITFSSFFLYLFLFFLYIKTARSKTSMDSTSYFNDIFDSNVASFRITNSLFENCRK
jgi:hypothetical protein